eukprot:3141463-Rhodomonas_salina.1
MSCVSSRHRMLSIPDTACDQTVVSTRHRMLSDLCQYQTWHAIRPLSVPDMAWSDSSNVSFRHRIA